jgi:hypothetical protein
MFHSSALSCLFALIVGAAVAGQAPYEGKPDNYPNWWFWRDVIPPIPTSAVKYIMVWPDDYLAVDDYAVINQGQLKHIAAMAAEELTLFGAGAPIEELVSGWASQTASADDYQVANVGQVKAVAALFDTTVSSDHYAAANVGQLKHLFSFSFEDEGFQLGNPSSFSYDYPEQTLRQIGPPKTIIRNVADEIQSVTTEGLFITDYTWMSHLPSGSGETITRISSDVGIVTPSPDAPFLWEGVSPGIANLTLATPTRSVTLRMQIETVEAHGPSMVLGFVPGSLIHHIHNTMESLVVNKTAGLTTQKFLNADGTRNQSLWTDSVDLSSIVIGNSENWIQGALVTPLHLIVARHVGTNVGATYSFRRADNIGTVTRAVASTLDLGGDILLVTLDAPITFANDGVRFAKVFPINIPSYWRPFSGSWRDQLPVLKCRTNDGGHRLGLSMSHNTFVSRPRPAWMEPWYVDWTSGDSGSVVGTVINGEFVFIGNAWTGPNYNDDGTSSVWNQRNQIEAALAGSGYSLTDVDLSGFPTY